jgi:hypothetical protein
MADSDLEDETVETNVIRPAFQKWKKAFSWFIRQKLFEEDDHRPSMMAIGDTKFWLFVSDLIVEFIGVPTILSFCPWDDDNLRYTLKPVADCVFPHENDTSYDLKTTHSVERTDNYFTLRLECEYAFKVVVRCRPDRSIKGRRMAL